LAPPQLRPLRDSTRREIKRLRLAERYVRRHLEARRIELRAGAGQAALEPDAAAALDAVLKARARQTAHRAALRRARESRVIRRWRRAARRQRLALFVRP